MKPISDPTLIAQLEGSATKPARKPVTDPGTLAALEGASPEGAGASEYFRMIDEGTQIARPNANVYPPILAELTDQGAAVTAGANRRAEGQRRAAESLASGEPGFRATTSDDLPSRTAGEFGEDMISLLRSGAKEGLALIPELPVRLANAYSTAAPYIPGAPQTPMLEQPDIVQQLSAAARGHAAEDAADVTQLQSLYGSEQGEIAQQDLGFWNGLAEQIKYGVSKPGAIAGELSRVGGQMIGGGMVPGAGVTVNLLAQGLQAGGLNAAQVRAELEAAGIPEDQIAEAEARTFGASAAMNTLLPKAIPGGTAVERVIAGKLGQGVRGSAARVAVPVVGETLTEGGAEGIDQAISNVATGKDPGQGVGAATGMGALIGAPMGATAGGIDALAAIANQGQDEDAAAGMVDLLSKAGLLTDPASLVRPPETAQEPAPAPAAPTAPAPAPISAPAAAPAAPVARTAPEVGTVIDNRIAELEAATASKMGKAEAKQLAADAAELEALLASQRKLRAAGALRSADNSLTDRELDEADARLTAAKQRLEQHRTGQSSEKQLTKLRARLDRIDNDADLAALAEEISPFQPPENRNVQEQAEEGRQAEARQEGQVGVEGAGRLPGQAQAQQQGQGAVNDQAEAQEGAGQKAVEEGQAGREGGRPVAAGVQGTQPGRPTDVNDPLSPREPAPVAAPEGVSRAELVERARNAPTPAARSEAAAQLAAFDKANPEAPKLRSAATIKDRVQRSLGTAFRGVNVHKGHQEAPEHLRKLLEQDGNDDVEGLYDPSTGEVHIFEDKLDTKRMSPEDRAVWVAAHERLGHAGIRGSFNGSVDSVLKRARQNPSVARIVKAMEGDRPEQGEIVVEEALAELAAALHTNDFSEIKNRYGVTFSPAEKTTLRRYIDNLIRAIRKAIGLSESVSDADIIALLADARRYAEENDAAPTGRASRAPVAQRVYQGSPTRGVEKMSTDKIGSGAGNRLYGWGLYFSNMREVAEGYRRGTSAVEAKAGGELADATLQKTGGDRVRAIELLKRSLASGRGSKMEIEGAINFIRADNNRGQLYQVEIPEDADLMNWDRRISTLSPELQLMVQAAVEGAGLTFEDKLGSDIYRDLELALGSDKAASAALDAAGVPGLKFMDGTNRRIGQPVTYNYVIWNEGAIGKPEPLIASRAASLLKNLTPNERKKVTDKVAAKIITQLEALPSKKEMAAVAVAGSAKRGWYRQSAETISAVFGPDAPKFAGLLAALSPQISVEGNLKNALNVWSDWVAAGRPDDKDEILRVMRASLNRTFGGSLPAWENNAARALQGVGILSGPKVDSFMRNLMGDVEEVTNDAWMANYALVNQTIFKGGLNKGGTDPGKGTGYLAMNARVRETARELTRLTGEPWSPAEVQETIWSWAKTLTESADSAAEIRNAEELVLDRAVSDELIASTPDFGTLFTHGDYRKILEDAGYADQLQQVDSQRAARQVADQGPGARRKAAAFADEDQLRLERQAAKRIDKLRKQRLDAERAGQAVTEAEEDIPFSRRQTKNVYGPDQGRDLVGLPVRVRVGETVYEFHGYEPAQAIAARYAAKHGNTLPATYAQVDEDRAKRIAAAYDRAQHQPQDPETKRAYAAMIEETLAQYRDILKTGLKVEFITGEDPYAASPREAILDVVENNHLWVFPTTDGFGSSEADVSDNPLLAETEFEISGRKALANDIFRVVHDYFGHIANGVGFRADGEENAWREHVAMYSPLAARAMTSETRGQNSWVNYGPNGEANRTASSADTVFADQKTTLLPKWVSEDGAGEIVASRGRARPYDSKAFGKEVIPAARKAMASLSPRASDAIKSFQMGVFSQGNTIESDERVQEEIEQAFAPVREALRAAFGDTVRLYRAQNRNPNGKRTMFSWSFSTEGGRSGAGAFMPRKYQERTDAEIDALVQKLKDRGHLTVDGQRYVRSKQAPEFGSDYYMIYDRNGEIVTDLVGADTLGRWMRQDRGFNQEQNASNSEKKALHSADVPVEQIKWVMADALSAEAIVERDPAAEGDEVIASRGWSAKKPQPDAVEVVGVHYSTKPGLTQLDPSKAGSAGAGRERRRFGVGQFGKRGGTAARLGFYVQDGDDLPPPEDVVRDAGGSNAYRVTLSNLYDLDADPRGLVTMNVDATEEAISDEGFDGFVTADVPGIDGRVAVVYDIGKKKIPVEQADDVIVASRRAVTESAPFKAWFGDWENPKANTSRGPSTSQVTNRDGSPMILYHSTPNDFDTFEIGRNGVVATTFGNFEVSRHGIFMAEDPQFSAEFAPKGATMPLYANIRSPVYLDDDHRYDYDAEFAEAGFNLSGLMRFKNQAEMWELFDQKEGAEFVRVAKELGYDGAFMYESASDGAQKEVWVAFSPEQVKSAVGNRGTFDPSDPSILASRRTPQQAMQQRATMLGNLAANGFPMGSPTQQPGGRFLPLKAAVNEARRKLQDKMLPVLKAQERTGAPNEPGVTSVTMDDAMNAYRMENLMYGRTRDRIEKADADYVLRVQRMMKNTGVSVEQLEDYLLARHAPERNARIASINPAKPDSGSGISTQQAQDILAGTAPGVYSGKPLSADTIRAAGHIAAVLDQMRDETIANLVSSGQITQSLATALQQRYKHYVPLRGREGDVDSATGRGTGRGLSVLTSGIKRALGRSQGSLAQNILGEMVGDLQRSIVTDEKSRVGQAFLKFAMANPAPDLYTVEPVDMEWKFSEATGEAYLGIKNSNEDADTTLIVRHNGKPVRIRFETEELAKALVNLDAPELNTVLKGMSLINRWRSAVLTRYNPGFAPVNLTRDAIFGITAVSAEHGPKIAAKTAAYYPASLRAMWRDARSKPGDSSVPNNLKTMDDWAREFAENGGKTGMTQVDDVLDLQRKMVAGSNTVMQLAAQGKPWAVAKESVKRALGPVIEVIEDFNDATENAMRVSVYRALREDGKSEAQAAEYAKNVTINFNRKGELASTLNAIYLFYNAAMQGTHAVFRVMKNPKVVGLLSSMAALQFVLATSMMDDDDDEDGVTAWDKVPDYVKRTSLVIPLGWKTGNPDDYFALPMPYGFNLFPYAGGRTAQWFTHGKRKTDTSIVGDIASSTVDAFSPVPLTEGSRSIFGDTLGFLMGLYGNTDDFGNPIVADRFAPEGTPKALLGKADTPQAYHLAARAMARMGGGDLDKRIAPVGPLDIAPEQIEALVSFATGGVGSIINRTGRLAEQSSAGNLDGVMETIAATPIANRFVSQGNTNRAVAERYYGEAGELRRGLDVLKERVRAGGPETFDATMGELTNDDPLMEGVEMERYKTDSKHGRRNQPKLTETGAPRLKAADGSAFESFKDAEKYIEDINRNLRTIRAATMTNDRLSTMMSPYGTVETDGTATDTASAQSRTRAIKMLQDERARIQQDFLRAVNRQRE